jgi:hypothetical protein
MHKKINIQKFLENNSQTSRPSASRRQAVVFVV